MGKLLLYKQERIFYGSGTVAHTASK